MRDRMFRDREYIQRLFKLTLPMAIQGLMLAAVAAADAFMLGNVEQNSMSAVSLATQIQFVQNLFLGAVTGSIVILGAQYWGKQDRDTVLDLFHMGLKMNVGVSLCFFAGCVFIPEVLMRIFTDQEALIRIGSEYLRIAGWSYLLTGISQCYLTIMKVSDHVAMSARISIWCVVINIVLNSIFIFGLFGVPAMGVKGAALATLIARTAEILWAVLISRRESYLSPVLKRFFVRNTLLLKDFIKCGAPLLGAGLLWGIGFTSYSAFMGHMGEDAVAANSVAAVVRDLVCCLCDGLAHGGGILVGYELGAGNLVKGKLYGERLMKMGFLIGFISLGIMLAVTPALLGFVKLTDAAKSNLIGMMAIMAFYMIGRATNTVIINGIFSAGGDTQFDLYSLVVCMWGIAIPLAALGTFVFHWNPLLVYACTCLDEVGKIPWVMIHFRKYKWVKDLTRDMSAEKAA